MRTLSHKALLVLRGSCSLRLVLEGFWGGPTGRGTPSHARFLAPAERGCGLLPTHLSDFRGSLPLYTKQCKVRACALSAASQTHPQALTMRALHVGNRTRTWMNNSVACRMTRGHEKPCMCMGKRRRVDEVVLRARRQFRRLSSAPVRWSSCAAAAVIMPCPWGAALSGYQAGLRGGLGPTLSRARSTPRSRAY